MSNLSEEKIINNIKTMLENNESIFEETGSYLYCNRSVEENIQGLLDLYNKEKEKNKELQEEIEDWKFTKKYVEDNYISKDKIKHKIIEFAKGDMGSVYLGIIPNQNCIDFTISKCDDNVKVGTLISPDKANKEEIVRLRFYNKKSVEATIDRLLKIHEIFEKWGEE